MEPILSAGSHRAKIVAQLPHDVYQLWGRTECLYIGATSQLGQRLTAHARKPWWREVRRMVTDRYPDKDSARAAERDLIQEHSPTHNIKSVLA